MNDPTTSTLRRERRAADRDAAKLAEKSIKGTRPSRLRVVAFLVVAVAVVGGGLFMATSVFMGQRDKTTIADALPVRLSMAGFDPKVIEAKAGQTLNLDFWNTDNAMHLDGGGVHTFIMPDQNIYVEIPAEARQAFSFKVPTAPGDYDFYCDTCCGGKASPTMHGTLRVKAATA